MKNLTLDLDVKALMRENLPDIFMLKGIFNSVFYFISVVLVDSHDLLSVKITQDSHVKAEFLDLI